MRASIPPLTLILFLSAPGMAVADPAHEWLMKMSGAVKQNNYQGTFIYRHGDQLEAMRIVHRSARDGMQERLISLNGAAREIIRNDKEVICYLPDKNSVVVEHRQANEKSFPSLLPQRLDKLDENYRIMLGGTDRIIDRQTQLLVIQPRDGYRYGYQLWVDTDSGLLLKANLIGDKGKVIEQFMFTSIEIGKTIRDADLQPGYSGKDIAWHRETWKGDEPVVGANWIARRVPRGFTLARRIARKVATQNKTVEHLVYSDGLTAVSVFIEKRSKSGKPPMSGATSMGAVHAYGALVNGHKVMVVGEVPADTVLLIGESISRR